MTANERRLLAALLVIAFAAVLVPVAIQGLQRLREAERSIGTYAAALAKIEGLDRDRSAIEERIRRLKESFGEETRSREELSFSDFVKGARALLLGLGIEPLRYQTIGEGKDESVEFTLRCDAFPLMAFLREVSRRDRAWAVTVLSIHPDDTGAVVNAVIRIRHAK